jgi:predicted PurR-regulated permease PerM
MLGVEYAELWGLAAGLLNTAPYFGPAIIAVSSFVGALLQFDEMKMALAVAGSTIVVQALVGAVFETWFASRMARMNATATFVGLLFFGAIWGLWGVLLGIPLLAIVKTVCDYTEDWKPLGELLGR